MSETYVTHLAIIVCNSTKLSMTQKERSLVSKNSNSFNAMIKGTSMSSKQLRKLNGNELLMTITISIVIIGAIFALGVVGYEMTAFAAKPQSNGAGKDVIENSNGFPSGKHYNLHISGKKLDFNPDPSTCSDDGGNTIFTPLYSSPTNSDLDEDQTISMYVNKKTGLDHLVVRDHCTQEFDGSAGQVQLPDKLNATTKITEGMWVFARALGGPDKGKDQTDSNIVLIPNPDVEACSLNGTSGEEDASDCFDNNGNKQDFVELGFITKNGIYKGDPDKNGTKLYRYTDDGETSSKPGKGAKNAVDITGLFIWSGIGCVDGLIQDGQITYNDFFIGNNNTNFLDAGDTLNGTSTVTHQNVLDAEAATGEGTDNLLIEEFTAEFDKLLEFLALDETFEACVAVDETWVFNLFGDDVDLVIQNHTIVNDGVSNLQIRFYPNQTTTFTP